jgi:hypothetical protein
MNTKPIHVHVWHLRLHSLETSMKNYSYMCHGQKMEEKKVPWSSHHHYLGIKSIYVLLFQTTMD